MALMKAGAIDLLASIAASTKPFDFFCRVQDRFVSVSNVVHGVKEEREREREREREKASPRPEYSDWLIWHHSFSPAWACRQEAV